MSPWRTRQPPDEFGQFLEDVTPFFYRRQVTYVDVGAHVGEVLEKLLNSRLKVREVHVIEPNAASLDAAKDRTAKLFKGRVLNYYPCALGARRGRVRMRSAGTMTKVLGPM